MIIEEKKVNVIGLGYVGLPSALLLAQKGFNILGTDISVKLINKLSTKEISFDEQEIEKVYLDVIEKDNLNFSCEVEKSDYYLICVPTPCDINNKADLSFVYKAIDNIILVLGENDIIIIESTIPVGTCKLIKEYIISKSKIKKPKICHCPERVLPGNSIKEILNNDRIIGGTDLDVTNEVVNLYKYWTNSKIVSMSSEEAELVKLIENSFRDVNIAFANTISRICRKFSLNSKSVIEAANLHPRVSILNPGIGVGGHCIPVDPYFLISQFSKENSLLLAAREINNKQPLFVLEKIINIINSKDKLLNIDILGLAYKINTSDIRESPAIKIIKILLEKYDNNKINLYDPLIKEKYVLGKKVFKNLEFKEISLKIILVDHSIFEGINGYDVIRATDLL